MNTLTLGQRELNLIRTIVVATCVALLALASTPHNASANQSGATVHDNAMAQIGLCTLLGGSVSVDTERTVGSGTIFIDVICSGGFLDGMFCVNDLNYTFCAFRVQPLVEETRGAPASEIEAVQQEPSATPVVTVITPPTGMVVEVTRGEPVVLTDDTVAPIELVVEPIQAEPATTDDTIDETVKPTEPVDDPIQDEPVVVDDVVAPTDPVADPANDAPVSDEPVNDGPSIFDDVAAPADSVLDTVTDVPVVEEPVIVNDVAAPADQVYEEPAKTDA